LIWWSAFFLPVLPGCSKNSLLMLRCTTTKNVQVPRFLCPWPRIFFSVRLPACGIIPLVINFSASRYFFWIAVISIMTYQKTEPITFCGLVFTWRPFIVCFAHSALDITKNIYRVCVCGDTETELYISCHCNVHCAAHPALLNKCSWNPHEVRTCWTLVAFKSRWFGATDASIPISVAVFNAVHEFLESCNRF